MTDILRKLALASVLAVSAAAVAQDEETTPIKPFENVEYSAEMQYSLSDGKTPLWLNANRYGLSSIDKSNGYVRAAVERPLSVDEGHRWGIGYGVDAALTQGFDSRVILQQAYVEGRWLHGALTVGQKQRPMEMKNQRLSSGSQTLGINARPVPEVRIAMPEYWVVPYTRGWVQLKGHIAYGALTDGSWQKDFTGDNNRWAEKVLYHSKAGYIRIGNEERFCPLSLELGLEMACLFGGTSHHVDDNNDIVENHTGLKDFLNVFIPNGGDATDGEFRDNNVGNQLGSWMIRLNYDAEEWQFGLYADKFFEDHSAMFQIDYDGYTTGEGWQETKWKNHRFFVYDFKDMMLGAELKLKYNNWIDNVVLEYIYSKYQSGPIYHDHTMTIADHVAGMDNFYNHNLYAGWTHWGQVMGNPLYRSPLYNEDGRLEVKDNRFWGFHLGLGGHPTDNLDYRVLASWQRGFGTYAEPYLRPKENLSMMAEATYAFTQAAGWMKNLSVSAAFGADFGRILGDNIGGQVTLRYKGIFGK